MPENPDPTLGSLSEQQAMGQWLRSLPADERLDPGPWLPPEMWDRVRVQVVGATTDEILRCREQALHSAAIMFDTGAQFPEDEAEKVVAVAKRFEAFMRTGQ